MFYGPADMHYAAKYADPSDILDSDKLLRQFLGGMPAQFASSYDTASAYALANSRTPPTLMLHGETDELVWVRQSERYADRLLGLHVQHAFLRIPWATHGFDYFFNGPGGQLADWSVGRFLDSITSR
jgi:acetyl esterase/lipase